MTLCYSNQSCFLQHSSSLVSDVAGLSVGPHGDGNALNISAFIPDTNPPSLTEFVLLNLSSGIITLRFNETIYPPSLDLSGLRLQSFYENPVSSYRLTNGTIIDSDMSQITIQLSDPDLVAIKQDRNLCTTQGNCYAWVDSTLIADSSGNQLSTVSNDDGRVVVNQFVDDNGPPNILEFFLDLNDSSLMLIFDEPVNPTTLDATAISIQSAQNVTSNSQRYTLTGYSMVNDESSSSLLISLLMEDVNNLKSSGYVTDVANTYLVVSNSLIEDMAFIPNSNNPIVNGEAINATAVYRDEVGPSLVSVTLDLNIDALQLTFNEPVDPFTVDVAGITLHSADSSALFQLTGGIISPTETTNGDLTVTILLTNPDISTIKNPSSETFTHLSIVENSVYDIANNPISNITDFEIEVIIFDESNAELLSFGIDMNVGVLTLTFDDIIVYNTFIPSSLTLQSNEVIMNGDSYTLQDSTAEGPNSNTINITLGETDRVRIFQLSYSMLAVEENGTYISIQADVFRDYMGADVVSVTSTRALRASYVIVDGVREQILNAVLDLDEGQLNITFTDIINADTFNLSGVSLLFSNGTPEMTTLQESSYTQSANAMDITIAISRSELDTIKDAYISDINQTVSVQFELNTVADFTSNSINFTIISVNNIVMDTTPPRVEAFSLDLDAGILNITFSEAISLHSADCRGAWIVGRQRRFHIEVCDNEETPSELNSVTFTLNAEDVDSLRMGYSSSETFYLSVQPNLVTDLSGIPVVPINISDALPADVVIPDETIPVLENFTLDLNTDTLVLTFSELVDNSTLDLSRFTLTAGTESNVFYTFGVYEDLTRNGYEVRLLLTSVDLNAIKDNPQLAVSNRTTYLIVGDMAAADYNDNFAELIPNATALPGLLIADTTPPVLEQFTINLDSLELVFNFSEIVQAESFNVSAITFSDGLTNITLNSSSVSTMDLPVLSIILSPEDSDLLFVSSNFGRNISSSILYLPPNVVVDFNSNSFEAPDFPIFANNVVDDSSSPTLLDFELDLNTNILTLQFNEPINIDALRVDGISIISNDSFAGPQIDLTSSTLLNEISSSRIMINITNDVNRIKASRVIGNSENDTFLITQGNFAFDLAGNNLGAIRPPGFMSTIVRQDEIRPEIVSYRFDLNTEMLSIRFSEPVDVLSANISSLIIVNETNGTELLRLTDGDIGITEYTLVNITLVTEDLNALKASSMLATDTSNTFISTEVDFIADTSGNHLSAIPLSDPLRASSVIADTRAPQLIEFTFSVDGGSLNLTFSETVDLDSFNVSKIMLQNSDDTPIPDFISLRLSDTSAVTIEDFNVIGIILTPADVSEIIEQRLCFNESECFVFFEDDLVRDTSSNSIQSSILRASDIVVDPAQPQLVQFFNLDFEAGTITIQFSKAILQSSIDFTQITLSALSDQNTTILTLTSGIVEELLGPLLTIRLSPTDLNELKSSRTLCSLRLACYLRFTSQAFTDITGNEIVPVGYGVLSSAHVPLSISPDVTGPELLNYTLDVDSGYLVLEFNEPVQMIDTTAITLLSDVNGTYSQTLSSIVASVSRNIVNITIPPGDLTALKADENVATSNLSTYLTWCRFTTSSYFSSHSSTNSNYGRILYTRHIPTCC